MSISDTLTVACAPQATRGNGARRRAWGSSGRIRRATENWRSLPRSGGVQSADTVDLEAKKLLENARSVAGNYVRQ